MEQVKKKYEFVILDACSMIKSSELHERGDKLITTEGVINEIRDKITQERMAILSITTDEPNEDSILQVKEMAKETGDVATLSKVDIEIAALAYQYFNDGKNVACMTSDFSIQNVISHFDIPVIAVHESIRQNYKFTLRCYACSKTTDRFGNPFCPTCGNKGTLRKVIYTIGEDGKRIIHINYKKPLRAVKASSLPTPRGGLHDNFPHIVEDQRLPPRRQTKFAKTENRVKEQILSSQDYTARDNPFPIRDVHSRSSRINCRFRR